MCVERGHARKYVFAVPSSPAAAHPGMRTPGSFWSRPRGPVLLGALACVACCAVPLSALVIGAGTASTLAAVAEPIAGVLVAAAATLGIVIYVRHRRARAAASCGCSPTTSRTLYSSPDPVPDAPVACTANLADKPKVQAGIDAYRRAFTHLIATERTTDGFRWRFRDSPGLETRLRELARAEHACCSFAKFDVTTDGDVIVWETRADASARGALDEYMRMPERLREEPRAGHDVEHLKGKALEAGMTFSADPPR